MEKEKLPIKFFAPREVDELKVEGAGNSEQPKWVLTGENLPRNRAMCSVSRRCFCLFCGL